MKRSLEILAPAGGIDCIKPAVRAGADAVYIGASKFSARSSAHNFDEQELRETVKYCHRCGTAVHLACNTIVHDDEIDSAMKVISLACDAGVDALIMQDIGLISLVRKYAPDMPIHGSTQLSVHTRHGVEYLHKMGLTRVVLSRELSKKEIEEIARDCPVELEVFVHGALCMSVSGQCYFSAVLGSRSGNRGACAQPCRLPFSVKGGTGHDLSLKDLSIIDRLRELEQMGIASAKIEGRMKRPEYVAAAVAACRESLDSGSVSPDTMEMLRAVFSRSGFTDGYYTGKTGVEMFGIRSKENVEAADSKTFGRIHEIYKNERQHIPVDFSLTVKKNHESVLSVEDKDGNKAVSIGMIPEQARNAPLDKVRCEKSLGKTGGTPYKLRNLKCSIDEGLMLPASVLNLMRTDCLEKISQQREKTKSIPVYNVERQRTNTRKSNRPDRYRARFTDDNIPDDFLDSELIYVPCTLSDKKLDALMDRGFAVAIDVPRGMFGIESIVFERIKRAKELGIYDVSAGNVAVIEMASQIGMEVHGSFGLNAANTETLSYFHSKGMTDCEVSFELTLEQISALGSVMPVGIISYGRLPLMLTRNCPAMNDGKGCKHCKTTPYIRDRKGIDFPLKCFGSCTEILNSVPLSMADKKDQMAGIDFEVLRFSVESPVEKSEILRQHKLGKTPSDGFTRGLYYRGV